MVKEEDLIKAVKANNIDKVEKLYVKSSGSFKKKKENVPSTKELAQKSQKVAVTHMNVNCHEEETGYTPFMIAVLNGFREVALSLIYHCADISEVDNKGNTALHLAVFTGRSDMIDVIINCEAKINQANNDGNTPLHIAVQNCAPGKLFLIFKLLQFGADLYAVNKSGHTPLDQAAVFGKQEAASALIDHDNNLRQNTRAIVEASIRGHSSMVQVLLDNGVHPNRQDRALGTCALHEAIRYERAEVASILLLHGANPDKPNGKGETAVDIARQCSSQKSSMFLALIRDGAQKPKQVPCFNRRESQVLDAQSSKQYPLLNNNLKWTKDTPDFCSSCTAQNPNYNILDGNPKSFWVIPATSHSWCVFDMGVEHTLTGLAILGWDSPQMVRKFELQRGLSFDDIINDAIYGVMSGFRGPWTSVGSFVCDRRGSTDPRDAGAHQEFHGFCATSQYWRLMIIDNYGGQCICFQGVQFYGADSRVNKFFSNAGFQDVADDFIIKGYNHYSDLLTVKESDVNQLITSSSEQERLHLALKDLKLRRYPLTVLNWLRVPALFTREGEVLPQVSVQADPEVSEQLQLSILPTHDSSNAMPCVVKGNCKTFLVPNGPKDVSVGTFNDIRLCTVGNYLLEVRSIRFPQVYVRTLEPLQVVAGPRDSNEVAAAFDELSSMLADMSSSLTM